MQRQLKKLVKLAEDYLEFSLMVHGWSQEYYYGREVWCYFAVDSDHRAVTIDQIHLSFHKPVKIECECNRLTIKSLFNLIAEYREKLDILKLEHKAKTKEEVKQDKMASISNLKKRLAELEEKEDEKNN